MNDVRRSREGRFRPVDQKKYDEGWEVAFGDKKKKKKKHVVKRQKGKKK